MFVENEQDNRIHVRRAARRRFWYLLVYLLECLFVCLWPPDQTKNYRDVKFGTHIPQRHLSKLLFKQHFVKKGNPQSRITWISAYIFDCLIFFYYHSEGTENRTPKDGVKYLITLYRVLNFKTRGERSRIHRALWGICGSNFCVPMFIVY